MYFCVASVLAGAWGDDIVDAVLEATGMGCGEGDGQGLNKN